MLDPLDANTLRPAREKAGLSRGDLAKLAQVDETTILRAETGGNPRLKTWARIVRAFTKKSRA